MRYTSHISFGEEPIENLKSENEKSLKKNLKADEEKPYISISKETSLIFIYCQLSQMAAAQGFLPIGVTLDASHNPSESCYLR